MARLTKAHIKWHNYEALKSAYDAAYPSAPYLNEKYNNNEQDDYSFSLRAALYFYVDMYDISSDLSWLQLATDTIVHILDNTDVRRDEKGDINVTPLANPETVDMYYQSPFPTQANGVPVFGWSSFNVNGGTGRLRCQVLIDGQVVGAMAHVADYILRKNIITYSTQANSALDYCKLVIDQHQPTWKEDQIKNDIFIKGCYYGQARDGTNTTFSTPLAYNHCGEFFHAALIYHYHRGEQLYLSMAEKFMTFMRDTRDDFGDRYEWRYSATLTFSEDINHGSYYMSTMLMYAYENNYLNVTKEEIKKYANSLVYAWRYSGVGNVAERFDGTGDIPAAEASNIAQMSELGRFNNEVYRMAADSLAVNYIPNYFSTYWGYSSLLRYAPEGIR